MKSIFTLNNPFIVGLVNSKCWISFFYLFPLICISITQHISIEACVSIRWTSSSITSPKFQHRAEVGKGSPIQVIYIKKKLGNQMWLRNSRTLLIKEICLCNIYTNVMAMRVLITPTIVIETSLYVGLYQNTHFQRIPFNANMLASTQALGIPHQTYSSLHCFLLLGLELFF